MDPRLLRLYNDELTHLREVGAEFAAEFPKIAGRLGMEGMEVADPYVERLLEGFAFLAARVQLKLESEQPRLIAHLLESTYPNFLAPLPSMMVARLTVDATDPNLVKGHLVPRGSALIAEAVRGQETHCEFRTAQDVTLWPVELVDVRYISHAGELPMARLPDAQAMQGGLRIRLRAGGGLRFDQIALDRLGFCISAPDDVAFRLHEIVGAHVIGSLVRDGATRDFAVPADGWRPRDSVRSTGFAAEESLLPESLRSFSGHRLLQEVSAMPRRLLFFDVADLAPRLAQVRHDEVELVLFFRRGDPSLEALVDVGSLSLFCTPAINLFSRRLDRIPVGSGQWEYHVVPDRTRPMDFEVHSIETVTGFGTGRVAQQRFLPLYETGLSSTSPSPGAATPSASDDAASAFYTVRREPRLLSQKQKQEGARSAYVGEEVYLAIVDQRQVPYREDLRQLSVSALVTNRDLPTLLPRGLSGSAAAWRLDSPGPVQRVDALHGPTRPVTRRPVGELGWSLVNHLALNHRSLIGETAQDAAATLRRTLELYAPPDDRSWSKQIDGVRSLATSSIVRRLPFAGPLTFGTGVSITVELDDLAFQGSSAYLLASVLEHFFARHAGINSFTQMSLITPQRGEVTRWPPRLGARPTL